MSVSIERETEAGADFPNDELIVSVINEALDYVGCPYECSINVLLTDDTGIRDMNRDFRGIDRATDVLSFPMLSFETPADFSGVEEDPSDYADPETGELVLGDIVISCERARAQAAEFGHSLKREVAFLTAHSMLHLCGYDHIDEAERSVMEQKQEEILTKLGITRETE
ncbi:MAG: rRNA maturation RNase YbeY [Lachnospiraceae bacterium]|nr:rRNA maturation RNase YbeY [Lachnospiraceae bacterium]